MTKIAVIGLGFVGLSLASFLGTKNFTVTGIDYDKVKIEKLRTGKTYFFDRLLISLYPCVK